MHAFPLLDTVCTDIPFVHVGVWQLSRVLYNIVCVCVCVLVQCSYVSMQAKRALSHCYQNVQNLSKQSNDSKFSVSVLFNQIAYIVIRNKF